MDIKELSIKLFNDFDPWERFDYTPEHIEEQILNDPIAVISALVQKYIDCD